MGAHRFDVFLNFRGKDIRKDFIDYLFEDLEAAGVHVFRDENGLTAGDSLSMIFPVISTCKIAIPVISKEYADSAWCLKELTDIMDGHRDHGISVFPVFYGVDVSDVRHQRGYFSEAFKKHDRRESRKDVKRWRKALKSVTMIRGWVSKTIRDDEVLLKKVVTKVRSELKTMRRRRGHRIPFGKKKRKSQCQVFLAFRDCDTGSNFAAYLSRHLRTAGIRVFDNDDPSLIGKNVADEIHTAINHCKIYIPILSKNYASSHYRLEALAHMVECRKKEGKKILPIFYKVKPSQVKHILSPFHRDMSRHKSKAHKNTYAQWKRAFSKVGSIKGYELEKIENGHRAKLVKRVVDKVLRLLKNR